MKYISFIFIVLAACTTGNKIVTEFQPIVLDANASEQQIEVTFQKGKSFNYPSFAFWTEDLEGNYIETLFVTMFVGKGTYGHGELEDGTWDNKPGEARRPASLPYWAHKRNIKASDGLYIPSPETQVPDAFTHATPLGNFRLGTGLEKKQSKKFRLLMEINQPWDSNRFWTNSKFSEDRDYLTSLQPALVYAVTIDPQNKDEIYHLNPIGHSHPSGKDGKLYTDLTTLTTAKEIAEKIIIRLK